LNTRHTRAKRFNSVLMNVWCVCIIDYGRQIVITLCGIVYVLGVQCIPCVDKGVDNTVCGLVGMGHSDMCIVAVRNGYMLCDGLCVVHDVLCIAFHVLIRVSTIQSVVW
jgi:hypothetical protein